MKGTEYEREKSKFASFSAKLYKHRWKEVTLFSKAVRKVRFLLQQCWSAQKYMRDGDGTKFDPTTVPDDQEVRGDGSGGDIAKFSLSRLTATIQCSFFNRFMDLVILVDDTPEAHIARWGSGCECHEELFEASDGSSMSEYMREKMMHNHFRGKAKTCIMAGKRASGFADGRIQEILFVCTAVAKLCVQPFSTVHLSICAIMNKGTQTTWTNAVAIAATSHKILLKMFKGQSNV